MSLVYPPSTYDKTYRGVAYDASDRYKKRENDSTKRISEDLEKDRTFDILPQDTSRSATSQPPTIDKATTYHHLQDEKSRSSYKAPTYENVPEERSRATTRRQSSGKSTFLAPEDKARSTGIIAPSGKSTHTQDEKSHFTTAPSLKSAPPTEAQADNSRLAGTSMKSSHTKVEKENSRFTTAPSRKSTGSGEVQEERSRRSSSYKAPAYENVQEEMPRSLYNIPTYEKLTAEKSKASYKAPTYEKMSEEKSKTSYKAPTYEEEEMSRAPYKTTAQDKKSRDSNRTPKYENLQSQTYKRSGYGSQSEKKFRESYPTPDNDNFQADTCRTCRRAPPTCDHFQEERPRCSYPTPDDDNFQADTCRTCHQVPPAPQPCRESYRTCATEDKFSSYSPHTSRAPGQTLRSTGLHPNSDKRLRFNRSSLSRRPPSNGATAVEEQSYREEIYTSPGGPYNNGRRLQSASKDRASTLKSKLSRNSGEVPPPDRGEMCDFVEEDDICPPPHNPSCLRPPLKNPSYPDPAFQEAQADVYLAVDALTEVCISGERNATCTPRCPRCGQRVYYGEKNPVDGNFFHKYCFTCANPRCRRPLDARLANCHNHELYCNFCYTKCFGPEGYGNANGIDGLRTTQGFPYSIDCPDWNINPSTEKAFCQPMRTQPPIPKVLRLPMASAFAEICFRCGARIDPTDKFIGASKAWHRNCFLCTMCRRKLTPSEYLVNKNGDICCKRCLWEPCERECCAIKVEDSHIYRDFKQPD